MADDDVQPFPIQPDLMAWLQQRADARHRGNVGVAIVAILEAARQAERDEQASRRPGGSPENPDRGPAPASPWAHLGR